MDYKKVLQDYKAACQRRQLSDEYLREQKCETRADLPITAEFPYGVVYLQDDAVDVLIKRIEELEARCKR